jgi:hypothetical protein
MFVLNGHTRTARSLARSLTPSPSSPLLTQCAHRPTGSAGNPTTRTCCFRARRTAPSACGTRARSSAWCAAAAATRAKRAAAPPVSLCRRARWSSTAKRSRLEVCLCTKPLYCSCARAAGVTPGRRRSGGAVRQHNLRCGSGERSDAVVEPGESIAMRDEGGPAATPQRVLNAPADERPQRHPAVRRLASGDPQYHRHRRRRPHHQGAQARTSSAVQRIMAPPCRCGTSPSRRRSTSSTPLPRWRASSGAPRRLQALARLDANNADDAQETAVPLTARHVRHRARPQNAALVGHCAAQQLGGCSLMAGAQGHQRPVRAAGYVGRALGRADGNAGTAIAEQARSLCELTSARRQWLDSGNELLTCSKVRRAVERGRSKGAGCRWR